ncbi:MAG: hypothetical protein MAG715_00269 [Methanonatronarchaeales archaeon]|nr:hypothetical protein [Methanonatronarchaeales archaeon]
MRVLLLTGRMSAELAEAAGGRMAEALGVEVDVEVLPVELGAFVTTGDVEGRDLSEYDLVLVPGLARGDYSRFENVFKGTRSVARLPLLGREDLENLSTRLPADRLIDAGFEAAEEGEPELYVGDLPVGGELPMRVVAEVVDATEMPREELLSRANYFLERGADVIDLGVPLDASPGEVGRTVASAREFLDAPLSVDTMDPDLIAAGLPHADMVLSADGAVLDGVGEQMAEAGVVAVVVPGDGGLRENVRRARALGLEAVADPVLDLPLAGMCEALCRYLEVDAPLFFGAGNVTELIDADSVGVNALLAAAAQEVGACMLFTTEHSVKTRGSVRELSVAARMMHTASRMETPPKDLGIDLLVLKDKVDGDEPVEPDGEVVEATWEGYERDPRGYFRIGLDRVEGEILAVFHPPEGEPLTVRGEDAASVYSEIVSRELVSTMDHAAYLGAELARAEAALATEKSYRQDFPLFEG